MASPSYRDPRPRVRFRVAQSLPDEFEMVLRRRDAGRGFLLEGVQHVNRTGKSDGENGAIRIPVKVLDHLKNAAPAEAFQRLCRRGLLTALSVKQSLTDLRANFGWKNHQIPAARTDEDTRFRFRKKERSGKRLTLWVALV
jgi:hypothetical protein